MNTLNPYHWINHPIVEGQSIPSLIMSTLSSAIQSVAADLKKPRFLHDFFVNLTREVEEETTRVEGDKTIVEKTKVPRAVTVPFAFKKPSRFERDEMDIYRSVWENRYVDAGIPPSSVLMGKYPDHIAQQREQHSILQRDFLLSETALKRLQINDPENKAAIEEEALRFMTLRQSILDFQQEHSVFFANTAETKARQKLIEWIVFVLTYYRPLNEKGEPGEWTPFFKGATIEEKMDSYDAIIEANDEMWREAHDVIELLATAYAGGGDVNEVVELYRAETATTQDKAS